MANAMVLRSLSGRFLILTVLFVMLAEVVIFVPSVTLFRLEFLKERLERSQIASLALLATTDDMVSAELEAELLKNAEVLTVSLRRDESRELILSSEVPAMVEAVVDLRDVSMLTAAKDAIAVLFGRSDRVILVMGQPVKDAGTLIEVAMQERPLRQAMLSYSWDIFRISLAISLIVAGLLFIASRRFLVRPISRVVHAIQDFEAAPEDARRVIEPSASITELKTAEQALKSMQTQLQSSLRQKERLANLGQAVSKISHDLRNILTTTQLMADRLEKSEDPLVKKMAPKMVGSISRAVNLCQRTLDFGRLDEPAPDLKPVALRDVIQDVAESEAMAIVGTNVSIDAEMQEDFEILADEEQIHRVLTNLVRNARQILASRDTGGLIQITAERTEGGSIICVKDDGPGIPAQIQATLFKPFHGTTKKGGAGLGLTIAAELIAGHGGRLELVETSENGTHFRITLPPAR